jgi:hypothetical protein
VTGAVAISETQEKCRGQTGRKRAGSPHSLVPVPRHFGDHAPAVPVRQRRDGSACLLLLPRWGDLWRAEDRRHFLGGNKTPSVSCMPSCLVNRLGAGCLASSIATVPVGPSAVRVHGRDLRRTEPDGCRMKSSRNHEPVVNKRDKCAQEVRFQHDGNVTGAWTHRRSDVRIRIAGRPSRTILDACRCHFAGCGGRMTDGA